MHGLKSAILAIFQKSPDWLHWPYPVIAALKNGSLKKNSLYILILIYFFRYETIENHACAFLTPIILILGTVSAVRS